MDEVLAKLHENLLKAKKRMKKTLINVEMIVILLKGTGYILNSNPIDRQLCHIEIIKHSLNNGAPAAILDHRTINSGSNPTEQVLIQ